jgi:YHS domain-containing protein
MPRGVRKVYPECFCEICGKKIRKIQIIRAFKYKGKPPRFCSNDCMAKYDKATSPNTLKEPMTWEELEENERLKRERMGELQTETKLLVQRQSPRNDSPEAERRLREALCPNPPDYVFAHGSVIP